ncbi:nuclear transport factor 2 family protein [Erythrobacter dokdonensis]|uniref:SnoaL_3 domain-containing protein n=1 Tax=Erythrobacter dokdonensis DSW-74 TaxID=1300349 RepID=A0A1A7BJ96_9SPHN|nr:nuclear transport factor 2 family protein [Erythrobacter dokdonensis]OBV11786.1 SnoaL_3 domain-containing protein [Erythrobacter dokdonensis DSW-74]
MADVAGQIEALELRLMRAWLAGDAKETKKLLGRDFMAMIGTLPPQLLDRPSFLAGIERGFACTRFAFHEVFVREHGKSAWFVAGAELELGLGAKVWSGPFLVTGLWRKGAIGGWKLAERSLAQLEAGDNLAAAVGKLQLWK